MKTLKNCVVFSTVVDWLRPKLYFKLDSAFTASLIYNSKRLQLLYENVWHENYVKYIYMMNLWVPYSSRTMIQWMLHPPSSRNHRNSYFNFSHLVIFRGTFLSITKVICYKMSISNWLIDYVESTSESYWF